MGPNKYTDEFRRSVAEAALEEGATLKAVGEKFGVHPTLVRNWKIKFSEDLYSGYLKSDEFKTVADFQKGLTAFQRGDFATALREWKSLAEQGYADAQVNLGVLYEKGQGVPQNYETAVKWYTLAAEQGNAVAQYNLGGMYRIGQGVPQNYKTAVKWYTLAAEQGDADAQYNLGVMYDNGEGVPLNDETAVKWYTLAAEQGHADAQYNLGVMYEKGEGVLNQVVEKTVPQPSPNEVIDDQFRVALVIGNGDYGSMGTLRNPANDARLMTKTLKNLGFEVIEEIDATQKKMKRAVGRFSERLDEGGDKSVALFYYAGHGMQSSGRNYLIPVDAEIDREGDISIESVAADDVLESMEYAEARVDFIILDACRNNPFVRSVRSGTRGLARMTSPKGSLIAYATSPGGVAADGDGDNSPYTLALTTAMMEGEPVERMFRKVRNKVMAVTKEMQTPWEASSLIGDDFFFSRRKKSN